MVRRGFPMVDLEFIGHLADHVIQKMRTPSLTKILGHPNLALMFSYKNITALAAVFVLTALASTHLVKYYVATTI